ncbi:hypothetical protein AX17_001808 [Amanita inopinata Kibby_2008]|nr:hypothetical protein AX17_001808 [Amanita inopinata Kibby_2008]
MGSEYGALDAIPTSLPRLSRELCTLILTKPKDSLLMWFNKQPSTRELWFLALNGITKGQVSLVHGLLGMAGSRLRTLRIGFADHIYDTGTEYARVSLSPLVCLERLTFVVTIVNLFPATFGSGVYDLSWIPIFFSRLSSPRLEYITIRMCIAHPIEFSLDLVTLDKLFYKIYQEHEGKLKKIRFAVEMPPTPLGFVVRDPFSGGGEDEVTPDDVMEVVGNAIFNEMEMCVRVGLIQVLWNPVHDFQDGKMGCEPW